MPQLNASFIAFLANLDVPANILEAITRSQTAVQGRLAEELEAFSMTAAGGKTRITPRFFVQGSWAYKTLNFPIPPQQMDVDLGIYLPHSYMEDQRPSIAAIDFFSKVDSVLSDLAQENAWAIDRSKDTCARILLDDLTHFDVPLYSIPDEDFKTLATITQSRCQPKELGDGGSKVTGDHQDVWSDLPTERVLLALRSGAWHPSDPRRIERWFSKEVSAKGEQFRRCCRYLKAWRDHLWRTGGPSSIFLMVVAAKTFSPSPDRDDLAFLELLRKLPAALKSLVTLPNDSGDDLLEMQKPEDLVRLANEAGLFYQDLSAAIQSHDLVRSHRSVARHLGPRFDLP